MFVLVHQGIICSHITNDRWPFSLGERHLGLRRVCTFAFKSYIKNWSISNRIPTDNLKILFQCAYAGIGSWNLSWFRL